MSTLSTRAFDVRAHAALFTVALIYGANYTIAKLVLDPGYLAPLPFIVVRILGATALFWLFHALFIRERLHRSDALRVALCAVFGVVLNMLLFFSGLKRTTPINASLLMTIVPIVVLLFSALLLAERITPRKVFGILLGAAGAILIITYQREVSFDSQQLWGNVLVALNATSFGLFLVLVKSLMARYQPLTVIKWVFAVGSLIVLPIGGYRLLEVSWMTFTPGIVAAVVFVVICTTFMTYLLNTYALGRVNASTVSIYVYLQPVLAAIIALGLGQESLSAVKIGGAALIFTGVALVSYRKRAAT